MLVYVLTSTGIVGVLLVSFLADRGRPGSWTTRALLNLKRFLLPFAATGLVFSGLQIWLAWSDDFEGAGRTVLEIEIELARLRTVVTFLKPTPWLEAAIYIALLVLLVWPAAVSLRRVGTAFGRYLTLISTAYVWLSLLTSLTFFGATAALESGPLAQRIAVLDRHVDRVEKRYASLVDAAALRLGSEWFPRLIQTRDHPDDDDWIATIAFAVEFDRYMRSVPPSYPGLFDGPADDGSNPPPPPGTGPKSPAASAAAIALFHRPIERPGLRIMRALLRLNETTGPAKRPLARREPDPAPPTLLPPQILARDLAGEFPVRAKDLGIAPTTLAAKQMGDHVYATRDVWSEEKAAEAEGQLKASDRPEASMDRSGTLFASIGARLAAAGYESQSDGVLDALKDDPAIGLPLGIIAAFVEAVVNDTVKAGIEDAADRAMERWLRGVSFMEASAAFGRDASVAVERYSGLRLRERLAALRQRLAVMRSRWEVEKEELPAQLAILSSKNSTARWAGLEAVWIQTSADLPPTLRDPALLSLTLMRHAFEQLDVPARLVRLEALENVWLASATPSPASRISAMLRCEVLMDTEGTDLENALFKVLPPVLSRDFDPPSAAEILVDASLEGADVEPSQRAQIVEAVRQMRAETLLSPAAVTAFVAASRASLPDQAHEQFNTAMRRVCVLHGRIDTYRVTNGVRYGPVASRPITTPCF